MASHAPAELPGIPQHLPAQLPEALGCRQAAEVLQRPVSATSLKSALSQPASSTCQRLPERRSQGRLVQMLRCFSTKSDGHAASDNPSALRPTVGDIVMVGKRQGRIVQDDKVSGKDLYPYKVKFDDNGQLSRWLKETAVRRPEAAVRRLDEEAEAAEPPADRSRPADKLHELWNQVMGQLADEDFLALLRPALQSRPWVRFELLLDNIRAEKRQGDCNFLTQAAQELMVAYGPAVRPLCSAVVLRSQAVAEWNPKFMQDDQIKTYGAFTYGGLSSFFGGLEALIGPPSPKVLETIVDEHCQRQDSTVLWVTENYKIETSPSTEWHFVFSPEAEPSRVWPSEQRHASHPRQVLPLATYDELRDKCNVRLKGLGEDEQLTQQEVVGVRLYTGPMYEKYNTVNRGGALSPNIKQSKVFQDKFWDLCKGNRYTTTIHVINSAIIKLGKLQKLQTVYRGVHGVLPQEFWHENELGARGGIEFGFLSTTMNRDVSKSYAGNGLKPTLLEIDMGMVDRGADLSPFSQYPHEKEICFAPLTGLEVLDTHVEDGVLIVKARLNINLAAMTIEQVIAKRKKVVVDMCSGLQAEVEQALQAHANGERRDEILRELSILKADESSKARSQKHFEEITQQRPEVFNDDETLRRNIASALNVKNFHWLRAESIDILAKSGEAAAPCLELVATRVRDDNVALPALRALRDIRATGSEETVAAVAARLGAENDRYVQEAAVQALASVAAPGDPQAIAAVRLQLEHRDEDIRRSALATLAALGAKGDQELMFAVAALFKDESREVRHAAVAALDRIAGGGDITGLRLRLEHADPDVRRLAVKALGDIAQQGDREVIQIVNAMIQDPDWEVRREVMAALEKVATKGDQTAISAATALLMDAKQDVQSSAVTVLETIAKGHRRTIDFVSSLVEDEQENIRRHAVEALGKIAEQGDHKVIHTVTTTLKDCEPDVRRAGVAALELTAKADQEAIDFVLTLLADDNWRFRKSAVEALGAIASQGSEQVIVAVIRRLRDEDFHVQIAAVATLEMIAQGDQKAIQPMRSMLADPNWMFRRRALEVLGKIVEQDDQTVVELVSGAVKDEVWNVRKAALLALQKIALPGDRKAIAVVQPALHDENANVRKEAKEALRVLRGGSQSPLMW